MKKFLLPIIILLTTLFFLSPKVDAQEGSDCHVTFNSESNNCLKENTKCINACVDKARAAMSLTVDGGKVNLECQRTVCDPAGETCNKTAKDNFNACIESRKAKEASAKENVKTQQQPPPKELTSQEINNWIMENNLVFNPSQIEQMEKEKFELETYGRTPQMTEEIIKQYKEEWNKMFEPGETTAPAPIRARVDHIKGEADYKLPGSDEWIPVKSGDVIPPGATLFTGMDTTLIFSVQDTGVFQMLPFTETVISEQGIKDNSFTDIKINTGEIEVSIPGGVYTGTLQISTPTSIAGVKGTHFWVKYDEDDKTTIVGVYEGKVEVTAKGSNESVFVSPQTDKPGIAVIEQKVSPIKLGLIALVCVAISGGVILVVKKKTTKKLSKRK